MGHQSHPGSFHTGFRAVLFDLDGTLLNTLDDLADSMNAVLRGMGFAEHSVDSYRYFVGDGVVNLARRALPKGSNDEVTVGECVARMKDEYDRRWDKKTRPYDGVVEMLDGLRERGAKLAVLSNKVDAFTQKSVARLLPGQRFHVVRGEVEGVGLKPDPTGALEIVGEMGVSPAEFLYVGDTATDMKTASAAGMCPVGALWGFRTREELVESGARRLVESPMQVLDLY